MPRMGGLSAIEQIRITTEPSVGYRLRMPLS
jgi:hypothetical protein